MTVAEVLIARRGDFDVYGYDPPVMMRSREHVRIVFVGPHSSQILTSIDRLEVERPITWLRGTVRPDTSRNARPDDATPDTVWPEGTP